MTYSNLINIAAAKLQTPKGTAKLCQYAASYIRDYNKTDHGGSKAIFTIVSETLIAAAAFIEPEEGQGEPEKPRKEELTLEQQLEESIMKLRPEGVQVDD